MTNINFKDIWKQIIVSKSKFDKNLYQISFLSIIISWLFSNQLKHIYYQFPADFQLLAKINLPLVDIATLIYSISGTVLITSFIQWLLANYLGIKGATYNWINENLLGLSLYVSVVTSLVSLTIFPFVKNNHILHDIILKLNNYDSISYFTIILGVIVAYATLIIPLLLVPFLGYVNKTKK